MKGSLSNCLAGTVSFNALCTDPAIDLTEILTEISQVVPPGPRVLQTGRSKNSKQHALEYSIFSMNNFFNFNPLKNVFYYNKILNES